MAVVPEALEILALKMSPNALQVGFEQLTAGLDGLDLVDPDLDVQLAVARLAA
jgi:hypothetical protein